MAFRRALLLFAGMSSISCSSVYDFDDYKALPSGGSGGGMSGSGGSGGGMSGSGGSGGVVSCDGIDFTQDPAHCGACGINCAGGDCNGGVCSPVETKLGVTGQQVATLGEKVFVVRGVAAPGEMVTYSADFVPIEGPLSTEPVCDAIGFLSPGPAKVYFRPQNSTGACGAESYVYSCGQAPTCGKTVHTVHPHINGVAVVNSDFYFLTSDGVLHMAPLSVDGFPSDIEFQPVRIESMVQLGLGAYMIAYDSARNALWWTTYDGCTYTVGVPQLPITSAGCSAQTVPNPGPVLISPDNKIYIGGVNAGIYSINPDVMVPEPALAFGAPELRLLAVDSDYVYAYDTAVASLVALRHGAAVERARIPVQGVIASADANHPKYVFFTVGSSLYRWRKPIP
jgi:hypothetical protein